MQEFLKSVSLNGKKIANKNLGQNFLVNEGVIKAIVECLEIDDNTNVVEIGCGLGSLTFEILQKTSNFIGIEKDVILVEILQNTFSKGRFLEGDALKIDFSKLINQNTVIVSNLPYNVGTKILLHLGVDVLSGIKKMVLMLQKDVIDKILSKPKTRDIHQLGVFFQSFCEISHICNVPASAFAPTPSVNSSVIKIVPQNHNTNLQEFWNFLQKCFTQRRKTIGKILGINGNFAQKRVEELSIAEFMEIFLGLKNIL